MLNCIEKIKKNINLEEGSKTIENILITIYLVEGISTKELARRNFLPLPITAAIKKEFIKEKLVIQDRGTRLTSNGIFFVEKELGFKNINKELYIRLLTNTQEEHKEITEIKEEIHNIFQCRPQADVTLDQSKSSVDTSLKRAMLCLKNYDLIWKNILCLGDDDLVSIALGFLLKKLFPHTFYQDTKITVIDIDKRIIEYINDTAMKESLPIKCEYADLRNSLSNKFKNRFDCFFTDPPYTLEGMNLFLSRGIEALKSHSDLNIYFSFAHKSSIYQLNMQKNFLTMGLAVSAVTLKFNTYEGAGIIGNTGQMIVLKTTDITKPLIKSTYKNLLYTGEFTKTIRFYKCKKCGKITKIGNSEKIKNIVILKNTGCCKCNNKIFDLLQRKNITI